MKQSEPELSGVYRAIRTLRHGCMQSLRDTAEGELTHTHTHTHTLTHSCLPGNSISSYGAVTQRALLKRGVLLTPGLSVCEEAHQGPV